MHIANTFKRRLLKGTLYLLNLYANTDCNILFLMSDNSYIVKAIYAT